MGELATIRNGYHWRHHTHVSGGEPFRRAGSDRRAGTMSLQLLVILVPVLFGLMGFALDLGRLYLVRGELNQAASAMALAAASKLMGTSASETNAESAAALLLDDSTGYGAKYNFGSILVAGASTGLLASSEATYAYYSTAAGAIGTSSSDEADATTARHVVVTLEAEAPLLFWGLLSLGQSRKTTIMGQAVAGISAPLCTICGIEPIAVARPDASAEEQDNVDFGFVQGTTYTFYYQCTSSTTGTSNRTPTGLTDIDENTTTAYPFVLIDRYDSEGDNSALEEGQQLFRIGAQGLLPNSAVNGNGVRLGCITYNSSLDTLWSSTGTALTPNTCSSSRPTGVKQFLCGLNTRFEGNTVYDSCTTESAEITDVETLASAYSADTDTNPYSTYSDYTGNGRRIITIPIVDALATDTETVMNVVGFRQFLLQPYSADTLNLEGSIDDTNGRFMAMYLGGDNTAGGNPVPVKQGSRLTSWSGTAAVSCDLTTGPGKVVLHQ